MRKLAAFIERQPEAAFGAFLLLHVLVWTALPAVLYLNLPLDLIEALIYGREWQLGYHKLPPLPWWMVEIAYRLAGHDIAYYLMAQLAVAVAFWMIWLTARPMVGPVGGLIAILIIDGTHYYNYTAAKFNHDVIQLPFWAMAGYAFWRALQDNLLRHWALLGFAVGMALWAKYFFVVLAAPIAMFLLWDGRARQSFSRPGPYVAIAVALVVMAPHLIWLVKNDFLPFAYAESRAAPSRGAFDHILHPAMFLVSQMLFLGPSLIVALSTVLPGPRAAAPKVDAYDLRISTLLAFGPMTAILALSALSGRGTISMWGYPLWLFLGVWVVMHGRGLIDSVRLGRIVATWAVIFFALTTSFIANYAVLPYYDGRYRAAFYPGEALAREVSKGFRAATGRPLTYVIGEMWTGGNIGHYAPERPRVLIDGDPHLAPWIDLADLHARGAVVVWPADADDPRTIPAKLAAEAGGAIVQPPIDLPFRATNRRLIVGWAVLPPAKQP